MAETNFPYWWEQSEWYLAMSPEEQADYKEKYEQEQKERERQYVRIQLGREQGYAWSKQRIKDLGYKSMADFQRRNGFIKMSASTINNYLKYASFPTWQLVLLAYALKSTPNAILTVYGLYEPDKTHKIEQA